MLIVNEMLADVRDDARCFLDWRANVIKAGGEVSSSVSSPSAGDDVELRCWYIRLPSKRKAVKISQPLLPEDSRFVLRCEMVN